MYIRLATGQADLSRAADLGRWTNDRLIPALRALPGFLGYHGGADPETGRIISITFWDTREHADALGPGIAAVLADLAALGVTMDTHLTFQRTATA